MATYAQINTLSKDAAFLGRIEVAVIKYADYILNESNATENRMKRWTWAVGVAQGNPGSVASRIAPFVAYDVVIQVDLGNSTDVQIQSAVETWINRVFQF